MKTLKINDFTSKALTSQKTSRIFGGTEVPPCDSTADPVADAINEALQDYYDMLDALANLSL